jgi:hypothetical protein
MDTMRVAFYVVAIVGFAACGPTAPKAPKENLDRFGCEIPRETVFAAAHIDLSLAKIKAGDFLKAEGGSAAIKDQLVSLASQGEIDDSLWAYTRCLLSRRDNLTPKQIAWYETLRAMKI